MEGAPVNVGQPPLLRRLNESAVLEAIRKHGPMSRARLARQLSLSKSTVSEIVGTLLERRLVREVSRERPGPAGRHATLLDIVPEAGFVAGVDCGGTLVRAAVADLKGAVRARRSDLTAHESLPALVDQLATEVARAAAQAGAQAERLLAVAVGVPGAVRAADSAIQLCPNVPFLEGVNLAELLQQRLHCPVVVDNDVNLGAVGEKWRGCAANFTDFAYLAVGTGVGMGVILNGSLYRGSHGFAGEVGYLPVPGPGGPTPLEQVVGGNAIVREFLRRQPGPTPPGVREARDVFERALAGDPAALAVTQEVAFALAWAIASVAAVLDLPLVVLGGGVGLNPALLPRVRELLHELVPVPPEVRPSVLGGDASLLGAIAVALRQGRMRIEDGRGCEP